MKPKYIKGVVPLYAVQPIHRKIWEALSGKSIEYAPSTLKAKEESK